MAHGKTPSLTELLKAQNNGKYTNSEPSLASLLSMSPKNSQHSSSLTPLRFQQNTGLPSLNELSKQNNLYESESRSLGSLLAVTKIESSERHLPSLSELLSPTRVEATSNIGGSGASDLHELMRKSKMDIKDDNTKACKTGSLCELMQNSTLDHNRNDGFEKVSDLSSLMTKVDLGMNETRKNKKTPNLSELLQKTSLNSPQEQQTDLKDLSNSLGAVLLSDLASNHIHGSSPLKHHKTLEYKQKIFVRRSVPYKKKVSSFGQIMGAMYVRHGRRRNALVVQEDEIIFTREMFGCKSVDDTYAFNEPSPDDFIKSIQDKAFERDSR